MTRLYRGGAAVACLGIACLSFSLLASTAVAQSARTGSITGNVVDSETGETLIGANVVLEGTIVGATTDLDGEYTIRPVEPGTYHLVFSYIGYTSVTVTDVVVTEGEATIVDLSLTPGAIGLEEVVVAARALENTDASLLKQRQKAAAVSDAISAEAIGRSGSSTAADAMEKVTGVSVVGGKYVYVRGLGDRYMNTQLNGATLPSADPDRNSVPLDLFPANLLDNIVTSKTFTPDKPGSFSGGSVNIGTKAFPDDFTVSFSSSISYKGNIRPGSDFLSYEDGSAGWLGNNGGTHTLPEVFNNPNLDIPNIGNAFTDAAAAQELDQLSRAFNGVMAPARLSAPINQSYSFSLGNQLPVFGRPLGVIASLSYSRNVREYENGSTARYTLTSSSAEELNNDFLFTDQRGTDEVLWGTLVNASYKPHPKHELGFNYMNNRSGESTARYQYGAFPRDLESDAVYETRTLQYVSREMDSYQTRGKHVLFGDSGLKIEWTGSVTNTLQDEPDLRFFTNDYLPEEGDETYYSISPAIYPVPTRYFRTMEEDLQSGALDASLPFRQWRGLSAQVKAGGSFERKTRAFRERRFEFRQDKVRYDGDPVGFFAEHTGLSEEASTARFFRFGNYILDVTQPSSSYDGDQDIAAGYLMLDIPLTRRLRAVGGLRVETTDMVVTSADSLLDQGVIDTQDVLPSMNLVYEIRDNMNVRLAQGRTLARPNFREIAPYASFSFIGDYIYLGNPELERSLIDNYDIRWEWFTRPGEILAVSGFYKYFRNPIERAIDPRAAASSPNVKFQNTDHAAVYGVEIEARKNLDQLAGFLRFVQAGANISFVRSRVAIEPSELELIRALRPDAADTRPLQGQSPYVVNLDLTYDNPEIGATASAYYNVFGRRLDRVAAGGTPNIFERPRHIVDLTVKKDLWFNFSIKGSAKNLLNQKTVFAHTYQSHDFIAESYSFGRSFSLGLSYALD